MSIWVTETLYQRLEFLREHVERIPEAVILHKKLKDLESEIQCKLDYKGRDLYAQWLDLQTELISLLIGWFYAKGVQDGMRILIFLKNTEEDLNKYKSEFQK